MLVSRTSKLAIIALADLAARGADEWTSADKLYQSFVEGLAFLRHIMNRLAREGIVRSKKGRRGGFQIAAPAGKLSLGQVVIAIEGSDSSRRCLLNSETCDGTVLCSLAPKWHPIRKMLFDFLNSETIQTAAERGIGRIDPFDIGVLDE